MTLNPPISTTTATAMPRVVADPGRPVHVALVNTLYHPDELGGAERSVRVLAQALQQQGQQVTVVRAGPDDRDYAVDGVTVLQRRTRNLYWFFDGQRHPAASRLAWHAVDAFNPMQVDGLAQLFQQRQVDVVHTHNLLGLSVATWAAATRVRIPIVHTTRDYYLMCQRSTMRKRAGACQRSCTRCRWFTWSRRRLSASVAPVVGVSDSILATHVGAGYFPNAARQVIYNAVGHMPAADHEGNGAVQAVTPGVQRVVGYLGRLEEPKGIELLIDAWCLAARPGWTLKIAGRGEPAYEAHQRQLAGDLPIEFLGTVRADEFLRGVDLLVVPSVWEEPMGRVVVESYLAGKPVIVTDRGGLPELVDEGLTGWTVAAEVPQLAARLGAVLAQPAQLAAMAPAIAHKALQFNAPHMASQYLAAYRQALTASGERDAG